MTDRPIQRALVSVFDKTGVADVGRALDARGIEVISTGGTARALREAGVSVRDVSELTGFPEMMDGRVKTLHPLVHGGLLMRRDLPAHTQAATDNGIVPIDLVVVNLYPFTEAISREGATESDCIEMIDIGGPSMVRSAAKNHHHVTVVTDPGDYGELIESLGTDGGTTLEQRRRWARKAFATTSAYDAAIQAWLGGDDRLPERLHVVAERRQTLRYGENPHQSAAAYVTDEQAGRGTVVRATQHGGKELSFNNYLDANAAYECANAFEEVACAIIKHKNPCGAAISQSGQLDAFHAAYEGDSLSAYGGIAAFNRPLSAEVARVIATKDKFFEVLIAPSFEDDAIEVLRTGAKWGKKLRILEAGPRPSDPTPDREIRWIRGGLLVQDPDDPPALEMKVVTERAPTPEEERDLRFAWAVAPHVTSNAIVFARDGRLVGVGAGQMSRVDAVEIAAKKGGPKCKGAVMASDAFFPFADNILAAHAAGIEAVIQPGGSIRDKDVIAACDEKGIAMVMTGVRHFRH